MTRMTIRLPEGLRSHLSSLADAEAVSLNQYIVDALTRQVILARTGQPLGETENEAQRAAQTALLQSLGQSALDQVRQVLSTRVPAKPETGLTPEVVEALQRRLARQPARR